MVVKCWIEYIFLKVSQIRLFENVHHCKSSFLKPGTVARALDGGKLYHFLDNNDNSYLFYVCFD